jgi:integrase
VPNTARRTRSRYPNIYYRETPHGRAYEVSFYDSAGRRRWQRVEGFDDVEAARDALAKAQCNKRTGTKTPPADATFAGVRDRYLASRRFAKLGPWTQKNYRAALETEQALVELGPVKIAAIDDSVLASIVSELEARERKQGKGRLRQSSVENILKPLRAVLAFAVKEKLLSASPFAALEEDRPTADEEPHEPHEWTDEELVRLLAASRRRAAEQTSRYDYSPLLTVATKAGLRLGELLGLEWPDCELVRGAGALNVRRRCTRLRETAPPKAGSAGACRSPTSLSACCSS